jgi:hypothetical protein
MDDSPVSRGSGRLSISRKKRSQSGNFVDIMPVTPKAVPNTRRRRPLVEKSFAAVSSHEKQLIQIVVTNGSADLFQCKERNQ